MTTDSASRPPRDSIGTRLTKVLAEPGLSLGAEEIREIGRRVARLYSENEEIERLRAINTAMCESHNSLLVALVRAEEDAAVRIVRAEGAVDAAYQVAGLIRRAATRATAGSTDGADTVIGEIEMLLTAAVALLDAKR